MIYRKLVAISLSLLLIETIVSGTASAAAPAALFLTPPSGQVTVLQTPSLTATWTENSAAGISSRMIVLQTSRPNGSLACDPRWVPLKADVVTTTRYSVTGLVPNSCYRFVLFLATATGRQTVTSATFVPSPAGYGATVDFTNPAGDVTSYDQTVTIDWVERDTLGSRITSRSLAWQKASAIGGTCAGANWSSWTTLAFVGHSIAQSLSRSTCYRYRMAIGDASGFRSQITSGILLVAGKLPNWTGTLDLYRPGSFASQANMTVCVAASTQLMLNLILGRSDSSAATQQTYIAYAQAHDAGSYTSGTDPAGWAATLDRYGGSTYSVATFADAGSALKQAVRRLRQTNKPVGLLVWAGLHAWVISGFSATADPAVTNEFNVTAVYVTGPLYPRPANALGYDPAPDTQMTPTQLSRYFAPFNDGPARSWTGKYVIVVP
jgi:hypothetical protein